MLRQLNMYLQVSRADGEDFIFLKLLKIASFSKFNCGFVNGHAYKLYSNIGRHLV